MKPKPPTLVTYIPVLPLHLWRAGLTLKLINVSDNSAICRKVHFLLTAPAASSAMTRHRVMLEGADSVCFFGKEEKMLSTF